MSDTEIERAAQNGPLGLNRAVESEVVPQAEGDGGELQATTSDAVIVEELVSVCTGNISHGASLKAAVNEELPESRGC
jgi:Fe-S cluster biogenesis protein NfuA